jgi:hypothetical protein
MRIACLMVALSLAAPVTAGVLTPDMQAIVARADLDYTTPARRSEEGMPIGNGRMGSLVWTTPSAIHFQINRDDVFAEDCTTTSFPRTHSDYASGCAFVDIDLGDPALAGGSDSGNFHQHLSIYDGLMTLNSSGVSARILATSDHDVFAIEVDDQRATPAPITVDLRMLRFLARYLRKPFPATDPHSNVVATGAHTATSALEIRDGITPSPGTPGEGRGEGSSPASQKDPHPNPLPGYRERGQGKPRILLTQHFQEASFYDASAVAVALLGRDARADYANETTVRLIASPGKGKFTVLIASSASFDRDTDVAAIALKEIDAVASNRFDDLLASNRKWWADYWDRGFIQMHSADGVADTLELNYHYFLYVMASCSRGEYPARFGGMLWYSNADLRAWGSLYWWANQSCYYNGLAPTNRFEILDPTFSMYTKMYDASALAAKQQWGSQGIWIPETTWFNGEPALPDELADEMRQLYLLKKPWSERSDLFMSYARCQESFNSRWNWISQDGHYELGLWVLQDKGAPPFGHVTHIFGTTAKIAYLFWQKFEYTRDETWLRERAFPMLRGCVEFYRKFPNLWKEADGRYHIHHTNSNEPAWGVRDSDEDMAAMHGIIPCAIRAAEILNVEPELRATWKEFLANLAPISTSDTPDALKPETYDGPRVWVKGTKPAAKAGGMLPDGNTLPEWNFDLATVHTQDEEMMQTANNTLDAFFRRGVNSETRVGTLSRLAIAAAQMGRADAVKYLVPNQMLHNERPSNDGIEIFRNRMALREGPGATECQRLGRGAEALHTALLQSAPPTPGADPIIRVFPAWPKEWNVSFKLLARGAFAVSASMQGGKIEFVEIESNAGGECRLVNPWGEVPVTVYRGGEKSEVGGLLLKLSTAKGESIVIVLKGSAKPSKNVS